MKVIVVALKVQAVAATIAPAVVVAKVETLNYRNMIRRLKNV
jgi:hypothetical protein